MLFPPLSGQSLQGESRLIPAHLPAHRTLVLLAFKQSQQRDVDAWMAVADSKGWLPDLSKPQAQTLQWATIEVPCISRRWGLVRRFIDGGMATAIANPAVLARTWTVYTDVDRVQRALGIVDSANIWVGVLDTGGRVLAHVMGLPNEDACSVITAAMVK